MIKLFSPWLLVALLGCAQIEKIDTSTLTVQQSWIRKTNKIPHFEFRYMNLMSPIVFKDMVIQANSLDSITAYNKETSAQIWKFYVNRGSVGGATLYKDGLYFGGGNGQFYALNALTGNILWSFPIHAESLSAPLVTENTVYHLASDGRLFAFNRINGKRMWTYARKGNANLEVRASSQPTLANGRLYAGFADGYAVSLNPENGQPHWERSIGVGERFNDVDGKPLVIKDLVIFTSYEKGLFALKISNGSTVWQHSVGGPWGPVLDKDNQMLYYSTENNEIHALKAESGQVVWKTSFKNGPTSQPLVYKGLVIAGEGKGQLWFINKTTGSPIRSYRPGTGLYARPTVDPESSRLYFLSNDANLFALKLLWQNNPKKMPWGDPL